ncbi:MAG: Rieske 2Fe-2S domain-containing protein [Nitrososphaerales archaeon]|jgi:nitrite reductase/ring-hydroxylating ferredoxin subunit
MSHLPQADGGSFVTVARADEVGEGSMFGVAVGGNAILLSEIGGKIYAMDAVCTHYGGYLPGGELKADHPGPGTSTVVCPVHKAQFDAKTGKVVKNVSGLLKLATHKEATDQRTYEVKVVGGNVMVKV